MLRLERFARAHHKSAEHHTESHSRAVSHGIRWAFWRRIGIGIGASDWDVFAKGTVHACALVADANERRNRFGIAVAIRTAAERRARACGGGGKIRPSGACARAYATRFARVIWGDARATIFNDGVGGHFGLTSNALVFFFSFVSSFILSQWAMGQPNGYE